MKKLLKWIIILTAIAVLYFQFGGSQIFKKFGKKGVEIGNDLEKIENKAKDLSNKVKKKVKKRVDKEIKSIEKKIR